MYIPNKRAKEQSMKCIITALIAILVCLAIMPTPGCAQTICVLSDTAKVRLNLDVLTTALRAIDMPMLSNIVGETVIADGEALSRDAFLQEISTAAEGLCGKVSSISHPSGEPMPPLWDFDIEFSSLSFQGDTCTVDCRVRLHRNPSSDYATETYRFTRIGKQWMLTELDETLEYLAGKGGKK